MCWPAAGAAPSIPTTVPQWRKFLFQYTDFTNAALAQTNSLLSLVAAGNVEGIEVFELVKFAGPGLGLAEVTCGDPAAVDSLSPAWSVFEVYDATRIQRPPLDVTYSKAAATALTVTLTADINLSLLTAGAFQVWLKLSRTA